MFVQGSQIFTSGFVQRPSFPHQDWVFEVLQPYLQDHPGQAMTALPSMDWPLSERFFQVLRTDLQGEWKSRGMAARRKMREMRLRRERPTERLSFGST